MTSQDTMRLGQYVNPDLCDSSSYYRKLDDMMKCVAKNAELARPGMEDMQDQVCAKEYRALRLEAFQGNVLFHNINARVFQDENQFMKGLSAY